MKAKTIKVTLYSGRHEIPGDPDPIYRDFKFRNFKPIPADSPVEGFEDMVDYLLNQLNTQEKIYLYIYVTGLTPALTDFLSKALPKANANRNHKIILLHYNRKRKEYEEQVVTRIP